ncbi:MAG: ABC transporter permease [Flavobacteriales bacterium]
MGKIGLIIWREYITRVRKPSFLIMTFLGPLLIAGAVTLMVYFSLKESSEQLVLVVDKPQLLTDKLKDGKDIHFFYTQQEQSDSAFKAGPYTLMVDVNEEVLTTNTVQFFYKELPGIITQRYVQAEIEKVLEKEKLRVNEVDPEVYASIKTSLKLQLFDIDKLGEESKDQELAIVGFFLGYIMFFFVFLYAVQVMRGVMEEKTNRIVEVLISSVKPFQLMMGKIVGIALVGFTQFLLWIVLTGVLATIGSTVMVAGKYSGEDLASQQMTVQMQEELGVDADEMPKIDESAVLGILDQINIPLVLALFGFYFLGGYLLYSSLFAAVGSAVDSEAETQQFMMPVTHPHHHRHLHRADGHAEPEQSGGVLGLHHSFHEPCRDDGARGHGHRLRAALGTGPEHGPADPRLPGHHLARGPHLPHRHPHVRQEGELEGAGEVAVLQGLNVGSWRLKVVAPSLPEPTVEHACSDHRSGDQHLQPARCGAGGGWRSAHPAQCRAAGVPGEGRHREGRDRRGCLCAGHGGVGGAPRSSAGARRGTHPGLRHLRPTQRAQRTGLRAAGAWDRFMASPSPWCPAVRRPQLILDGVRQAVPFGDRPHLVMDIGGGSIEFILATGNALLWKQSFELGVTRLRERFPAPDPLPADAELRIATHLDERLGPLWAMMEHHRPHTLIGSAGSFDTLAAMLAAETGRTLGDEEASLTFPLDAFDELKERLLRLPADERAQAARPSPAPG